MEVMLGWTSGTEVHFLYAVCDWNCKHPYNTNSKVRLNNSPEKKVNTCWMSTYPDSCARRGSLARDPSRFAGCYNLKELLDSN